jgi:nucleoside 2-deoxyribosyltransferase
MNIYFAGAIRGGREKVNDYVKIVNKLQEIGNVLTTHVADTNLSNKGENNLSLKDIYDRDVEWLKSSELIVAEISIPSLGIGYELGLAESLGKKVICLYDINSDKTLSAMIGGNDNFEIVKYNSIDEVLEYLEKLK